MDRAADLLADYEALGAKLEAAEGSNAAALVRERRILRGLLDGLDTGEGEAVVDKLAGNVTRMDKNRRGRSGAPGAPARGRKSG